MLHFLYCGHFDERVKSAVLFRIFLPGALGWSDFHFFEIFENGQIAIDWLYFYEFNSKKLANFAACASGVRVAKFLFLKITCRDLENEYFF